MPWNNPDHVEHIPRPIVAVGNEYPPAFELDWHQHRRGQLLYASRGVVVVSTPHGAWVAPPERAVWTPGGCRHSVRMVGAVSTRSVLIEPHAPGSLGPVNRVIQMSPLLRNLLETACLIEPEYVIGSRDDLVMSLLMAELARAPTVPLAVPFPQSPEIAARCRAFLDQPTPQGNRPQLWDMAAAGMPARRAATTCRRRGRDHHRARSGVRQPRRLYDHVQAAHRRPAQPLPAGQRRLGRRRQLQVQRGQAVDNEALVISEAIRAVGVPIAIYVDL
jgi:hypothetical protein